MQDSGRQEAMLKEALNAYRKRHKVTQKEVAELFGVPVRTVHKWSQEPRGKETSMAKVLAWCLNKL